MTLSHTSGIVLVGVLTSLGAGWAAPQKIEAYLSLGMGILVVALGLWMLWTQRELLALAIGEPAIARPHSHTRTRSHSHAHEHAHAEQHSGHHHHSGAHDHAHVHDGIEHDHSMGWHSHGWGTYHSHRLDLVTDDARPKIAVLLALGVAGGLLPDPIALALLLAALSSGKVLLGLATVLVFSLGFAAALVVVGVVAAFVGRRVLDWLSSVWVVRVQIATTLVILGMGCVLTVKAVALVSALPS
ncbi:MAG: sulfite exporter TauE/SafE family protein [Acetobacteraceae bacterium]|nr:sulfite exporter TauE/SafE family protein [Acetobacteraceae bacterium]